ncbi:hypothetical protein PR048_022893 [Dryococelus australis]|uniref:Tc1-like transposase DDE domain-containing protein n=1 Tax=Dryococelus australis TaxID=614101 RepID=A0ABQ9GSJ8_9NEOP|nr:hypothetical protein PR048_022893 [Dryococelus australis]
MAYSSLLPHHPALAFSTYPSPILLPFSAPFPVLAPPPPHTGSILLQHIPTFHHPLINAAASAGAHGRRGGREGNDAYPAAFILVSTLAEATVYFHPCSDAPLGNSSESLCAEGASWTRVTSRMIMPGAMFEKLLCSGTPNDNVRRLDWPVHSPDLNPIEHLWDELDRRVRARQARPKYIAQLVEWLQEEWRRIPVDVVQTLVESMPDRVAAVIATIGGPTG